MALKKKRKQKIILENNRLFFLKEKHYTINFVQC